MFLGVMDSNGNRASNDNGNVILQEEGHNLMGNGHGHPQGQGQNETSSDRMPFIMVFLKKRLHILPVFTAVFIFISFIISYSTAVSYGHVEPIFPYISYTAIEAPERCLFAQLINMGAFLLATNVYIRYKYMCQVLTLLTNGVSKLNIASLVSGLLSAFGLTMVANFQTVEMRAWHYVGAGTAFLMGSIYCWMQSVISIRFRRGWDKVTVCQIINAVFQTVFMIMFAVSKILYKLRKDPDTNMTKWDKLRPTYLVSTVSEWLTALAIVTFVLTFYTDFMNARLHLPRVSVMREEVVYQHYRLNNVETTHPAPPLEASSVQNDSPV